MTYQDAIAALEAAKASGDVAAIIAAADALASAGQPAKAPAKARKAKDSRPDWFTADAKAKGKASRLKHSLECWFLDGSRVQVNAWQLASDKPVAIGRALTVAIEFLRQRGGSAEAFRAAIPAFAVVRLVDGPNERETFDAAECSQLTEGLRAAIPAETRESAGDRIARIRVALDTANRCLGAAKLAPGENGGALHRATANVSYWTDMLKSAEAEAAWAARAAVTVAEAAGAEAEAETVEAAPSCSGVETAAPGVVASDVEAEEAELAEIEAEPLHAAYPDAEEEPSRPVGYANPLGDGFTRLPSDLPPLPSDHADDCKAREGTFIATAGGRPAARQIWLKCHFLRAGVVIGEREELHGSGEVWRARLPLQVLDGFMHQRGIKVSGLPRKPRARMSAEERAHPVVHADRLAALAAARAARPLPFPDRGQPYRPRPRYTAGFWAGHVADVKARREADAARTEREREAGAPCSGVERPGARVVAFKPRASFSATVAASALVLGADWRRVVS